ncbi:EAL domain-containing protein [Azoarcus indigens]|uniref:PAS domain S-box-containing protein/diguanylate cyclase (GGDEF)-like protein n=1 Tax=Azoarcus indigens TaxID=29545 RepID=A0A4R6ED99_9RHOO|nr:EAL domain-containing protein [Azoarcus indigens]NMG63620.1 EAL domain-containing protein [Azoarcus indigens]TDN56155.1 PAS domain S-box-containing protein/diguanylate cyclase (GGDEF)-like protein [Azoarcus indigens]
MKASPSRSGDSDHDVRGGVMLLTATVVMVLVVLGMMSWSAMRWDATLRESVVPLDRLALSRQAVIQAELFAERVLAGDPASSPELVLGNLERAVHAGRDLASGQARLAGMSARHPASPELRAAVADYLAVLQTMAERVKSRIASPEQVSGLDLRALHGPFASSAMRVEVALLQEMEARRQFQRELDRINLFLVCALAIGFIWLGYRAELLRLRALHDVLAGKERLRAFADALPEMAFLLDAEGRYLEVFGSGRVLAGGGERLTGMRLQELYPPEQAAAFAGVIARALGEGRVVSHEYTLEDGAAPRQFEARVAPVADTGRVVWVSWDVTERRAAERRVADLSRLYNLLSQVNHAIVLTSDRAALFERVTAVAVSSGGFLAAWVAVPAGGRLQPVAASGAAPALLDAWSLPLAGHVAAGGQPESVIARLPAGSKEGGAPGRSRELLIEKLMPLQAGWRGQAAEAGASRFIAIPLHCEGEFAGVMGLLSAAPQQAGDEEAALLGEVGDDISYALTQFAREAEARRKDERILLHAAVLEGTRDGVVVTDAETRILSVNRAFTEITGYTEDEVLGRTPALLRSGRHDKAFFHAMWATLNSVGHWQGELWNRRKNGEVVPQWMSISAVHGGTGSGGHYVGVFTDISQLRQFEERVSHLAQYDPLTDLPNRMLIGARLQHAIEAAGRERHVVGVLFIDLDRFKNINDALGHDAGDELLSAVAARLSGRYRSEDTLGRYGGDEFVLVLGQLRHAADAAAIARDLLAALDQPFVLHTGREIYIKASIGISIYPDDGDSPAGLIQDADAAMYQAKHAGRNTFRFYQEAFTRSADARLSLESRLRRALEGDGFEMYYQPFVDVASGRIVGAEALVRLKPDGGPYIGPAEFIPLLEESGLIFELGTWVQRRVCRQGREWLDQGLDFERLAVNLSAEEVRRGGVVERLRDILAETGFPAAKLEIEITESGLIHRGAEALAFLHELKGLGVQLAIDDFGTGYSSLAYLKRFPVSKLKIDRSFISDLPDDHSDAQLTTTIIELARNLGLQVLAEGVETDAQRAFLAERGCDVYQGYLCSPPVAAAQFAERFLGASCQHWPARD